MERTSKKLHIAQQKRSLAAPVRREKGMTASQIGTAIRANQRMRAQELKAIDAINSDLLLSPQEKQAKIDAHESAINDYTAAIEQLKYGQAEAPA